MSNGPIPSHVDPRKLADRNITLKGELPLAAFGRVCEQLNDGEGIVQVAFEFDRDERGAPVIHASLQAQVHMTCQRCLETAALPIGGEYDYLVVREGSSSDSVPKAFDALEVGEEPLDLFELIEDELLLALPIVPVHDPEVCQPPAALDESAPSEDGASRSNPFSVLAQLKRDPNG